MYKLFYGTIFSFMIIAGFLVASQVFAIDGDYVTPYSDSLIIRQCAQDDKECVNAQPGTPIGRQSGLPIMTLLGGVLLVGGLFAAVFWKAKEKKRSIKETV
jgi:hypothetical protein